MELLQLLETLPLSLFVLVGILVLAVSVAGYAYASGRRRQQVLGRVDGRTVVVNPGSIFVDEKVGLFERLGRGLRGIIPRPLKDSRPTAGKLMKAGFEGPEAPVIFGAVQITSVLLLPLLAYALLPRTDVTFFFGGVALALIIGMLLPAAGLNYLVRRRQLSLRRALPECLDLLVVCVEAGVSLDAALLRVGRELRSTHRVLADELLVINRKVNAGVPRERALQGLYDRTGVDELRSLVASMVQSERWGTSIATVLRVYSETLRRKRRQFAEKKAGEAAVKMLIPLVLFLLPALFVVLLGPGVLLVLEMLRTMSGG